MPLNVNLSPVKKSKSDNNGMKVVDIDEGDAILQ